MIKVLCFDFDGTITDTKDLVKKTFFEVLDRLEFNYNKIKAEKLFGEKTEVMLKKLGFDEKNIMKIKRNFFDELILKIEDLNIALCSPIRPLFLLKKKYKFFLISNNNRIFLEAALKKLNINKLFDEVYSDEDFLTKDKMLKEIFKKEKISNKEAVYIGDRFSDVIAAKRAGCYSIVTHNICSWSSLKEIEKVKPDFIISNFNDLKKVLDFLNS